MAVAQNKQRQRSGHASPMYMQLRTTHCVRWPLLAAASSAVGFQATDARRDRVGGEAGESVVGGVASDAAQSLSLSPFHATASTAPRTSPCYATIGLVLITCGAGYAVQADICQGSWPVHL
jgi:hypothetical protein